jgi:hypothetical protein
LGKIKGARMPKPVLEIEVKRIFIVEGFNLVIAREAVKPNLTQQGLADLMGNIEGWNQSGVCKKETQIRHKIDKEALKPLAKIFKLKFKLL